MISRKIGTTILLLAAIAVTGCAVGSRTTGRSGRCAVSFICTDPGKISVSVDGGRPCRLWSVDAARYDKKRTLKRTKKNTLWLSSGIHRIVVEKDGRTLYDQEVNMTSAVYFVIRLQEKETGRKD